MTDVATLERRCPRLGGSVTFGYCRTGGDSGDPCFKILDCWWERFDVAGMLRQELDADQFARLSDQQPPQKISSLIDLIAKSRRRLEKK